MTKIIYLLKNLYLDYYICPETSIKTVQNIASKCNAHVIFRNLYIKTN